MDAESSLIIACRLGMDYVVKLLIRDGVNIHHSNDEALYVACGNLRLSTVKILVDEGCEVNAADGRFLFVAVSNARSTDEKAEVVEYLLDQGATFTPELTDWICRLFRLNNERFLNRLINEFNLPNLDQCLIQYVLNQPLNVLQRDGLKLFENHLGLVSRGTLLTCLCKIPPIMSLVETLVDYLNGDYVDNEVIHSRVDRIRLQSSNTEERSVIEFLLRKGFSMSVSVPVFAAYAGDVQIFKLIQSYVDLSPQTFASCLDQVNIRLKSLGEDCPQFSELKEYLLEIESLVCG